MVTVVVSGSVVYVLVPVLFVVARGIVAVVCELTRARAIRGVAAQAAAGGTLVLERRGDGSMLLIAPVGAPVAAVAAVVVDG
ncbi:hypothetical protein OG948_02045 [Embleya sp. NBC_00888]|uniref:hypothetical protein n=1 Tax=Embleya sp. NBC_00888 TaxID=2975960 RepID=UPI0038679F7C|nr:hypothetical protein OG948_02045 [Embleya sp. NBC_00888]